MDFPTPDRGSRDELYLWMGRMEAKLDALLSSQDAHGKRLDNHGDRLSRLERGHAWVLGAAAVVATVVQFLPLPKF